LIYPKISSIYPIWVLFSKKTGLLNLGTLARLVTLTRIWSLQALLNSPISTYSLTYKGPRVLGLVIVAAASSLEAPIAASLDESHIS